MNYYNNITYTTEKMLQLEYWLSKIKDGKKILMNESQIKHFNVQISSDLCKKGCLYNCAEIYSQNADVRYGICVKRCDIRRFPSYSPVYGEELSQAERYTDYGQKTAMLVNEAVLILKESPDMLWYYIRNYYYEGWVEKSKIGLCDDYYHWRSCQQMEKFVIITADELTTQFDLNRKNVSRKTVSMGTKFELVKEEENYIVKMPVIDSDGGIAYEQIKMPRSSDISVGYMNYSVENVLKQAFKALGDAYGWGGIHGMRDCSSYVMEIYRCFGFLLPRDVFCQQNINSSINYVNMQQLEENDKTAILDSILPGALLGFKGHTMIYLGEDSGKYYVISYLKSIYKDRKCYLYNSCMINSLDVQRINRKTWLDSLEYVKFII